MNPPSSTAADHTTSNKHKQHDVEEEEQEGDVALPGFRFRPTDEELVGFYLHRKVNKKPMKIDHLIMQIDIYRYDPWDLPKASNNAGETEWYFFCKRGRKYRNSIRPNRVTGSGFWKATGIDKPVYASGVGAGRQSYHQCIGLKKTLVYYRGCAGKGTKTDWMMHEFRLPVDNSSSPTTTASPTDHKSNPPEAEVWTVCRIFKRNSSYKKYIPQWRENMPSKKHGAATDTGTSRRYSTMDCGSDQESYISFGTSENKPVNASIYYHQDERKPINIVACVDGKNQMQLQDGSQGRGGASSSAATDLFSSAGPPLMQYQAPDPSAAASSSSCFTSGINAMDQFTPENWDELRSVVDLAFGPRHPSSDQS